MTTTDVVCYFSFSTSVCRPGVERDLTQTGFDSGLLFMGTSCCHVFTLKIFSDRRLVTVGARLSSSEGSNIPSASKLFSKD